MSKSILSKLTRIGKKDYFSEFVYDALYLKEEITTKEAEQLFRVALEFIYEYEECAKRNEDSSYYIDFAYTVIAKTCFKIEDYRALLDFTINYGYYPIAKKILEMKNKSDISFNEWIVVERLKEFTDATDEKVNTYEQQIVSEKVLSDQNKVITYLAPTSYGKSELIFRHIEKNKSKQNIAIIVPTKALIFQTYNIAKKSNLERKIIINDEDFSEKSSKKILAIVTQERALKLLEQNLVFDILYIDEAHELLDFNYKSFHNNRSLLLTRLIRLSRIKNENLQEVYLSPILDDADKLRLVNDKEIISHKISNNLKIIEINYVNINKEYKLFVQNLNHFLLIKENVDQIDYIHSKSKEKNLHFVNRLKKMEEYAGVLANSLQDLEIPPEVNEIIEELNQVVHPEFKMIDYLKKGVIYLHAKIPSIIRDYLISAFKKIPFLKHIVANSVILAGMNLPIDTLFYIDGFNVSTKNLINLIGRVNRLNEIFKGDNLHKIFVPVHFIEWDGWVGKKRGHKKKIESLRNADEYKVKNPMLQNFNKSDATENIKKIVLIEDKIIESVNKPDFHSLLLRAGAQQILNYNEQGLKMLESRLESNNINEENILDTMQRIFFENFDQTHFNPEMPVLRLQKSGIIEFYKKFIHNLVNSPLKTRIENIYNYWKAQAKTNNDYKVYIGSSFGEIQNSESDKFEKQLCYVSVNDHLDDEKYLYNLAIIKLNVEEEFVSFQLSLLLNTLKEFGVISEEQINMLMYGNIDKEAIKIIRAGLSRSAFRKIKEDKMLEYIYWNEFDNPVAQNELAEYIEEQEGIYKFELEYFFM